MRLTPRYLSFAALLCTAAALPGFAQAPAASDAKIVADVQAVLSNEQALRGQTITPTAAHGVVTLSGSVSTT
jgi:osmotically-inducible protein OsmY